MNDVEKCCINFDVVTMAGLGADNAAITIDTALKKLYENDTNVRAEVKRVNENNVVEFKQHHHCNDLALLICGHDFTSAMLEWMRKHGRKSNMGRTGLESIIRMLYNPAKFHTTLLYQHLHDWEIEKGREIVA